MLSASLRAGVFTAGGTEEGRCFPSGHPFFAKEKVWCLQASVLSENDIFQTPLLAMGVLSKLASPEFKPFIVLNPTIVFLTRCILFKLLYLIPVSCTNGSVGDNPINSVSG